MRDASYRVIYYPNVGRYTALAWNYDAAVLLGTADFPTYTEARNELGAMAEKHNVRLRWFDGEYEAVGGLLYPRNLESEAS